MEYAINKDVLRNAVKNNPTAVMEPYDKLIGLDGFDAICQLATDVSGFTIYVPSARKIFSKCIELEAQKEFDQGGVSLAQLAKKYGYSDRYMRRLINVK